MSTGIVFTLPRSKSSTFVVKLFKIVGTLTNLLMSSLSNSTFKAIKSFLAAKSLAIYQHQITCFNYF